MEGTMKSSTQWFARWMAILLALLLAFPTSEAGFAAAQQADQTKAQTAGLGIAETTLPDNPEPQNPQPALQNGQSTTPQSKQPQDNTHKPVGTAAAPYQPTVGIAGSRPAGAAIAPAKQRRVRTIVISLGVIAGAGIAIGSVAALSHGSPSRP